MNTKPKTSLRLPLMAAAIGVVLACTGDAHVGCEPTLTCSLRPARFAPPPAYDAGPQTCDLSLRRCAAAQVAAGAAHTCAVTDAGDVLCWGDDAQAQRGRTLDDPSAVRASSVSEGFGADADVYVAAVSRVLAGAKQVAAGGAHSCALLRNGSVECWGRNAAGQVGAHDLGVNIEEPRRVDIGSATQIDAGGSHSCAVVDDAVWCWGSGQYGQSGGGSSSAALAPQRVPGSEGAVEVSCGARHTCARLKTNQVVCWGELIDASGQAAIVSEPAAVPNLSALGVSAGAGHTCALTTDYAVVCWGNNASGQLGDGTFDPHAQPVPVLGFEEGAGEVAAGGGEVAGDLVGHSCAIDKSSQVACWGRDLEGQLGIGVEADSPTPRAVQLARVFDTTDPNTLDNIVEIDLGALHSCAVDSSGGVYCWGDDSFGQLGSDLGGGMRGPDDMPPPPGRARRVGRFGSMR